MSFIRPTKKQTTFKGNFESCRKIFAAVKGKFVDQTTNSSWHSKVGGSHNKTTTNKRLTAAVAKFNDTEKEINQNHQKLHIPTKSWPGCFVFLIENIHTKFARESKERENHPAPIMSVLNNSGDELPECPLCMEPLEVDDLSFYPCTCGYQICRFCWHRIRTDENELCPACRKPYPENPADFKPLTQEQVSCTITTFS